MSELQEKQEDYAFQFINDIDQSIMHSIAIGKQSRWSKNYYWDNTNRFESYLFQYTLSGSGTIEINNETYTVDKGKCFFIRMPGRSKYYFDENNNEAPWEFIFILFNGNQIRSYCDYIEKHYGNVFEIPVYSAAIQSLLLIHSDAGKGLFDNPFLLNSRVFEFISLLCSCCGNKKEQGISYLAREFLNAGFNKDIGIIDCANHLSVSQSHLSREFYKCFGEKPIDYLTRIRLREAVRLLTTTSEEVETISKKCGFTSANYFAKVFKKRMKKTPSQFRAYMRAEGFSNVQI